MNFLDGIPNILYKYRFWEETFHRKTLIHNELFFASGEMFNDPFDTNLPFRYDKSQLTKENIIQKLIQVNKSNFPLLSDDDHFKIAQKRFSEVDFFSDDYWKPHEKIINQKLHQEFGICSFSASNSNLLMWAHYANSHKGFCIGFDKFELFNTLGGTLGKVEYSNDFPTIPLFGNWRKFDKLLNVKSPHWIYENEYRITKAQSAKQTFCLKDSAIKEVILGCRIDIKARTEIINVVKAKKSNIKLFDAVRDETSFKLNLIEIL